MNQVNASEEVMKMRAQTVNDYVEKSLRSIKHPAVAPIVELNRSMQYSAMNGGKRFRPVLSLLIGEMFGTASDRILPFATAVEYVHTYSLIHDDLPCMDNDDIRRGKPTNHKIYGEDFALLAGDALLTEAFHLIIENYSDDPELAIDLVKILSAAAGIRGMVGGQAIDLRANNKKFDLAELTELHLLKTGALIRVATEGAARIAKASADQISHLRTFGEGLGLAFQVADDILDHGEKDQDARSFTGILGVEETRNYLRNISVQALKDLHLVFEKAPLLEYLINFNQTRSF